MNTNEEVYKIFAEEVYKMLSSQRFADWYQEDFDRHLTECDSKDKAAILEDIKKMLGKK